jgi:glutamine amidotransferase-like uncharacterized protein
MPPLCKKIKDEKLGLPRVKKLRRLTAPVFKIFVLAIFLTALFYSANMSKVRSQEPTVYFISMQTDLQSNSMNAVRLVNSLLHLNMRVYWLAEPLDISVDGLEYALASGDFIIPFPQYLASGDFIHSSLQYFEKLSTELNVTIIKTRCNEEIRAYQLKQPEVAVFSGGGVTGGSLEHVRLLEEAGFSLGIVTEENLRRGELSEYNVVTFPGGGPYGNYLSETDMKSIRDFVRLGGGFLGTCGGLVLGIELGLLNAEVAIEGQYEAYAGLRGAVLLNVSKSSSPIVFGYSNLFESTYFMGPFISRVGSDVETICSYYCPIEDIPLYFPEIMEAYNFSSQAEVINNFWGSPSIISGRCAAGKVVLSTVHPEILPSSQRLFINSIFYLSSGEETLLKRSYYEYALKTPKQNLREHKSLGSINNTLFCRVRGLMSTLEERSSNAQGVLTGLEEANYQIVGVSGEYLTLFLDEINYRSSSLLIQQDESINLYEAFENFKALSKNRVLQEIPPLIRNNLSLSIEYLQKRFLNIYHSMLESGDLINILDLAEEELLGEKLLLQQMLTGNTPSADRYQDIVNLHTSESLTLCNLKDDLDYYLLNWSFEIRRVLIEAHFFNHLACMLIC